MKERHLDVFGHAMEREKPTLIFEAIEGGIPSHGAADLWHNALHEPIEFAADGLFPARHCRQVGLNRCISIPFRDLRIPARDNTGDWVSLLAALEGLGVAGDLRGMLESVLQFKKGEWR